MVKCVKVEKKKAEETRKKLASAGALDGSFVTGRDEKFVYFPVKGKVIGQKLVEKKLVKREEHGMPFYERLKGLSTKEKEGLVKSFDIVGDIAVLEIPPALARREKEIAEAVMAVQHNIRVVAKKTGGTAGEFRIRPVAVVAGEKRTNTVYREGGCDFELDLNKTYFSGRLGTERERIANLVKKGERVLVPFAGVGPFAIRIAKKQPSARVVGIELNPDAEKYFEGNVARNKCNNATAILGDVAKLLPGKYKRWADRVAMPLPKDASEFLVNVIPCLKKGGVLHYYSFGEIDAPYKKAEKDVKEAAKKAGRKARIAFRRVVRPYSKSMEQVVVDATIE